MAMMSLGTSVLARGWRTQDRLDHRNHDAASSQALEAGSFLGGLDAGGAQAQMPTTFPFHWKDRKPREGGPTSHHIIGAQIRGNGGQGAQGVEEDPGTAHLIEGLVQKPKQLPVVGLERLGPGRHQYTEQQKPYLLGNVGFAKFAKFAPSLAPLGPDA